MRKLDIFSCHKHATWVDMFKTIIIILLSWTAGVLLFQAFVWAVFDVPHFGSDVLRMLLALLAITLMLVGLLNIMTFPFRYLLGIIWRHRLRAFTKRHADVLAAKWDQSHQIDAYGMPVLTAWCQEVEYFLRGVAAPGLSRGQRAGLQGNGYQKAYTIVTAIARQRAENGLRATEREQAEIRQRAKEREQAEELYQAAERWRRSNGR
jgi:hypothetical protein